MIECGGLSRRAHPAVAAALFGIVLCGRLVLPAEADTIPAPVAESAATTSPECPDSALQKPVLDPHAWALHCFAVSEGEAAGQPASLAEFLADLDHDGVPELFIGSLIARGNAGGAHYVFNAQGTVYRYLGSLALHPKAFAILPLSADGHPMVRRYVHLGAGEGLLETLVHDGRAFAVVSSKKVSLEGDAEGGLARILGCPPVADSQPPQGVPALGVRKAVELAEAYVLRSKLDLSGQYVRSAALLFDEKQHGGLYWLVQWMWSEPRMGGEFGLRVYMDGRIVEARLGP